MIKRDKTYSRRSQYLEANFFFDGKLWNKFKVFLFSFFEFQILRNHVMVRVGGGWDTLQHYLDKHDPCRCRAGKSHKFVEKEIRICKIRETVVRVINKSYCVYDCCCSVVRNEKTGKNCGRDRRIPIFTYDRRIFRTLERS